jgi:hypothetical protein
VHILPTPGLSCAKSLEKRAGPLRAPAALMITTLENVDELTEKIIGCAIEVHRSVGGVIGVGVPGMPDH